MLGAVAMAAAPVSAPAQVQPSRSTDYLYASGPVDARALWTNPAGLGVVPNASLLAELSLGRNQPDGWHTSQYTIGLSTRAGSFGYQRDRVPGARSVGTWRIGGGFNLGSAALGAAIALYGSRRGWDLGLRYAPTPRVALAGVVRNLGRPQAGDSILRITGVGAVSLRLGSGLVLAGEMTGIERRVVPGYDVFFRGGLQLVFPGRVPLTALANLRFDRDLQAQQWTAGIAIGGYSQLVAIAGGWAPGATGGMENLSFAAVSTSLRQSTRRSGMTRHM